MSDDEKAYIKSICVFFYPENPPAEINDKLGDVASRMLHAALEKSKALDLVPRPAGNRPGLVWLLLEAVKLFWRTQGKTRIYEIARKAVALQHRSEYELAKMGI